MDGNTFFDLFFMIRTYIPKLICLSMLLLEGCIYSQKVLVYEKIPQSSHCMSYSNYLKVAACEEAHLRKQNSEFQVSLKKSTYRLERIHNQGDRCAIQNKVSRPAGCDISIIPSRRYQNQPPENFQSNPYIFPGMDHR